MKLKFSITLIIILLSNLAYAEITEDMERRAEEAGIIIMRDHDVKRTYYCNDQFARETHMNMQVAYRYSQVGDVEKAAQLELIAANRGLVRKLQCDECGSMAIIRATSYW